jgi:hypothetical protein
MEKKVYTAGEMAQLYAHKPREWLLLQVIERDRSGRATKLRLLYHAKDKDKLREYLLDKEDWTLNSDIIYVYSDPDKACDLL